jgi:hypothetical protein
VARPLEVTLDEHALVAERGFRLALRRFQRRGEALGFRTTRMPLPPPPAEALISTG